MRWEDERYVRLYTRDTPDWLALGWEARLVFYELLRKVDRAGVIAWGKSRERGLAVLLHLPVEIVAAGLASLVGDGCVMTSDTQIVIPNFLDAQECKKSDAERKREQRERDRTRALDSVSDVTKRDASSRSVTQESQNVTDSHDSSHAVTDGHSASQSVTPCLTVPSRTVPKQDPPLAPLAGGPARSGIFVASKPKPKRGRMPATFMRPDWQPERQTIETLQREGIDAEAMVAEFVDYWVGEGKSKSNWDATFRNRCRAQHTAGRAPEYHAPPPLLTRPTEPEPSEGPPVTLDLDSLFPEPEKPKSTFELLEVTRAS